MATLCKGKAKCRWKPPTAGMPLSLEAGSLEVLKTAEAGYGRCLLSGPPGGSGGVAPEGNSSPSPGVLPQQTTQGPAQRAGAPGAVRRREVTPRYRVGTCFAPQMLFSGEAVSQGKDVSPARGGENTHLLSGGLRGTDSGLKTTAKVAPARGSSKTRHKTRAALCAHSCTL